jgi:hypothetical protein
LSVSLCAAPLHLVGLFAGGLSLLLYIVSRCCPLKRLSDKFVRQRP